MNAYPNRDDPLYTVRERVTQGTAPDQNINIASFFAVDFSNRASGYYHLGGSDVDALAKSVGEYDIDYVIYHTSEWPVEAYLALAERYQLARRWEFGAVFAVE